MGFFQVCLVFLNSLNLKLLERTLSNDRKMCFFFLSIYLSFCRFVNLVYRDRKKLIKLQGDFEVALGNLDLATYLSVCPRSLDQFYVLTCYKKWAKTSWTYSTEPLFIYIYFFNILSVYALWTETYLLSIYPRSHGIEQCVWYSGPPRLKNRKMRPSIQDSLCVPAWIQAPTHQGWRSRIFF